MMHYVKFESVNIYWQNINLVVYFTIAKSPNFPAIICYYTSASVQLTYSENGQ